MADRLANIASIASLLLCVLTTVKAGLTPTAPGPGQTFEAGSNCTIRWDVDQSGRWNNVTIDLMSGSNMNMSLVTHVVSGLDGTDSSLTPFNWTCPEVDPYSAIYFYQFTNDGQSGDPMWTTRFTIASPNNETIPPAYDTQPSGDAIPWGIGQLLANNSASSSTAANSTTACDPSNLPHLEQIHMQDLHSEANNDDDRHGSDEDDNEEDSDGKDGGGDGHNSQGEGKDTSGDDDEDENSGTKTKAGSSGRTKSATSSTGQAKSATATGSSVKTNSRTKAPSASGSAKASNALAPSVPTVSLPPVVKKVSATGSGLKTTPTLDTAHASSSTAACQCASVPNTQAGGLKLMSYCNVKAAQESIEEPYFGYIQLRLPSYSCYGKACLDDIHAKDKRLFQISILHLMQIATKSYRYLSVLHDYGVPTEVLSGHRGATWRMLKVVANQLLLEVMSQNGSLTELGHNTEFEIRGRVRGAIIVRTL
ncbi:hypothetical protein BC835DRAFT_1526282 [Cytidiella melzeri]|nr:hypothetical protein BC835DRAFT_1526282 [Cytidiella melzeri]